MAGAFDRPAQITLRLLKAELGASDFAGFLLDFTQQSVGRVAIVACAMVRAKILKHLQLCIETGDARLPEIDDCAQFLHFLGWCHDKLQNSFLRVREILVAPVPPDYP